MKIHSPFCHGWSKVKQHPRIVNSTGANVVPEVLPEPLLLRRTPPAHPTSYADYTFGLGFTPSAQGGPCRLNCNAAFSLFAHAYFAGSPKSHSLVFPTQVAIHTAA
ncbi:hypothetical protein B0T14DRAFT_495467 [Immersiella caudata]|uniref:Uncharacterized protein n=1 Tax=Immersiella caudata TaxID=314043 RepID=A0AA40C3X3_9PEZI|nr:hypothetical protein B0T14DRAFT_495467 [Immersiella caudata]